MCFISAGQCLPGNTTLLSISVKCALSFIPLCVVCVFYPRSQARREDRRCPRSEWFPMPPHCAMKRFPSIEGVCCVQESLAFNSPRDHNTGTNVFPCFIFATEYICLARIQFVALASRGKKLKIKKSGVVLVILTSLFHSQPSLSHANYARFFFFALFTHGW